MWRLLLVGFFSHAALAQVIIGPSQFGATQPGPRFGAGNDQFAAGLAPLPSGRLLLAWVDFGRSPVLGEVRVGVFNPSSSSIVLVPLDEPEPFNDEPDVACGSLSCFVVWVGRTTEN